MMTTTDSPTEAQVLAFYNNCDYWPAKEGYTYRPRQLHIPLLIYSQYRQIIAKACESAANGIVTISLKDDNCKEIAPVLLHESLFHFYKAFYNYLAARSLYFGGMLHWINITLYYAKFYLARSITVLAGKQWYRIARTGRYESESRIFIQEIAKALANNKGKEPDAYRLRMNLDVGKRECDLIFDKGRVSSHSDVWEDYKSLPFERLNLLSLAFDPGDLIEERNEENYSFEGYTQMDFNLPLPSFSGYFERDHVKQDADRIFDTGSGEVLLALSSHLRLYRKLQVEQLPIEKEKLAHIIDYCLPSSKAKDHLLLLCSEDFPTRELHLYDGSYFFDEQDRFL